MEKRKLLGLYNRASTLRHWEPNNSCYHFELTCNEIGNSIISVTSHFVDWADSEFRSELRAASLVRPDFLVEHWEENNIPYIVVHNEEEFTLFKLVGGNCLVEQELAEQAAKDLIEAKPVIMHGMTGFASPELMNPGAFKKAPNPKLRMQVLKRDGFKCRICGRSPDNHTDLELHVHHIRPWAKHGVTDISNLITLCQTCHKGLDPHQDLSLFKYISDEPWSIEKKKKQIKDYRRKMRDMLLSHKN